MSGRLAGLHLDEALRGATARGAAEDLALVEALEAIEAGALSGDAQRRPGSGE